MMSGMGPGAIRWPWASCAFVSLDRPPAVSRAEGIEAMGSSLSWKMMSLWALALSVACSPRPMPPGLELNVRIPMRDGVSLVADVATPGALQRSPVIVELTPYGRGLEGINYRNELEYWVTHGYAFVIVDARGQGESEGVFEFLAREGEDAHDLIAWIGEQPWSDGRVSMRGSSYSGINQLYAARQRPPYLRCITPSATPKGPMEDVPYQGGALRFDWALTWPTALSDSGVDVPTIIEWWDLLGHRPLMTVDEVVFGGPLALYKRYLENPPTSDHWRQLQFTEADYAKIGVPSLSFSGWFDGTLAGTLAHYQGMRKHSVAVGKHFLIVGPWEHMTSPDGGYSYQTGERITRVGDLELPQHAFLPGKEITREFFDWCAKSEGEFTQSPVRIYLTGSNRWLEFADYPPSETEVRPLFLYSAGGANGVAGDGTLRWEPPGVLPADDFVYDPLNPFPSAIRDAEGVWRSLGSQPVDITMLLDRSDVLSYVTMPLAESLSIAGNVSLVLWASSDAADTDFVSLIEDVAPDGTAMKLGSKFGGHIRARFRNGTEREEWLVPGEATEFTVDYADIGHTFRQGHRIRVTVTSSAYPWIFPNPNTGHAMATDTNKPLKARQRVYHDADRPSRVLLPTITLQ